MECFCFGSWYYPAFLDEISQEADEISQEADEISQEADDSLLQDSIFDEFGDLQQQVVQHLDVIWDSSPTETGEHTFHA